jgi:hypothetical protein
MKTKFQSEEDFIKDYNEYRKGRRWKIMIEDEGIMRSEYIKDSLYTSHLETALYFYHNQGIGVGVVDLRHKFEKVCKLPELDVQ